jgi:hypothetical protein
LHVIIHLFEFPGIPGAHGWAAALEGFPNGKGGQSAAFP